ncbi:hypothetical protein G6M85_07900 [Agrobacterium tumefaciens]|uniref:inositol monophosphatase family protein n=1 Tax=Agrobacterium tumefaciens TaxID=358 RepID=UPI001572A8AB|nr:inositol monophosphatase family protein [Agrobacterium tumefaciens]NTE65535.1 hypothetical protein [Agrobacterium tumefaciens]
MTNPAISTLAEFADTLAEAARKIIRSPHELLHSSWKADGSIVTEMDLVIERELRAIIKQRFPDHGIVGEEFDNENVDADYVWVIDPIDGTDLFATGLPGYATLIGLCRQGKPVLGVIDSAATGQRWIGGDGIGSFCNGEKLQTRPCLSLEQAIMATYSPDYFEGAERRDLDLLIESTRLRVYGGSSLSYGQLAAGLIDIGIEAQHDIVDYCALVPVVTNAGGRITDWEGRNLGLGSGSRFVACGDPQLHERILTLLRDEDLAD